MMRMMRMPSPLEATWFRCASAENDPLMPATICEPRRRSMIFSICWRSCGRPKEKPVASSYELLADFFQQRIHFRHHLKRVGDVNDIGFAACPAAVCVQRNRPALADEPPADHVRLFAVAASGETLGVARRVARLPDLIHMRQERKYGIPFAALIH